MINEFLFWAIAAITVIPSLSLLFAKKAVHVAMSVVLVMVGLAIAYIILAAPFLGMVQIVVYTGAVMMLFLFVLMLVGVDQTEDLKETIPGLRWIGVVAAFGMGALVITAISRVTIGLQDPPDGNPEAIAGQIFGRWVVVMETLGFLLVTAAVGALVLSHAPRLVARHTQREVARDRIRVGANPVNKPMPGVYARHNALDIPALDPQGNPVDESVSRVLAVRDQTQDGEEFRAKLERGDES
jgi:NADH-quinone oxidoreductase subunit J